MNVATIKTFDIANGTGVRVSLFVSGCTHKCPECFNEVAWDFSYGEPFTEETEKKLLDALAPTPIEGLSLLGGEPFEPVNQEGLLPFVKKVKALYPNKTIWCYTGYLFEELIGEKPSRAYTKISEELLSYIDVLVDGEFKRELKDLTLQFRGSSNQRLLDVKKSLEAREAIPFHVGDSELKKQTRQNGLR